jgi:hypothetical protein
VIYTVYDRGASQSGYTLWEGTPMETTLAEQL